MLSHEEPNVSFPEPAVCFFLVDAIHKPVQIRLEVSRKRINLQLPVVLHLLLATEISEIDVALYF